MKISQIFFSLCLIQSVLAGELKLDYDNQVDSDSDGKIDFRIVRYERGNVEFYTRVSLQNNHTWQKSMEIILIDGKQVYVDALRGEGRIKLFHGHEGITIQETDSDRDDVFETISIRDKQGNFIDEARRNKNGILVPISQKEFNLIKSAERKANDASSKELFK